MANQNKVSATMDPAVIADNLAAIDSIRSNLPFLVSLTKEERKRLAHAVGDQTFNTLSLTFAAQHPEALPGTFNKVEYAKDGTLNTPFQNLVAAINQLHEQINDTNIALGSDIYSQSLDVYAFAKANNRTGMYDAYLDSVKARFAKGPRQPATPPTP